MKHFCRLGAPCWASGSIVPGFLSYFHTKLLLEIVCGKLLLDDILFVR